MELLRIQNIWWLTALATHVCSISLLGVLQSYPELSTLASYLNGTSALNTLLTNANNFTFLAANNNAIGKFLAQQYKNTLSEDDLEAITQYSLLKGGFPTLSFSDTPDFAASNLVNATYANVTAGQAAELVLSSSGAHQVITGNKNVSAITTSVCHQRESCILCYTPTDETYPRTLSAPAVSSTSSTRSHPYRSPPSPKSPPHAFSTSSRSSTRAAF